MLFLIGLPVLVGLLVMDKQFGLLLHTGSRNLQLFFGCIHLIFQLIQRRPQGLKLVLLHTVEVRMPKITLLGVEMVPQGGRRKTIAK